MRRGSFSQRAQSSRLDSALLVYGGDRGGGAAAARAEASRAAPQQQAPPAAPEAAGREGVAAREAAAARRASARAARTASVTERVQRMSDAAAAAEEAQNGLPPPKPLHPGDEDEDEEDDDPSARAHRSRRPLSDRVDAALAMQLPREPDEPEPVAAATPSTVGIPPPPISPSPVSTRRSTMIGISTPTIPEDTHEGEEASRAAPTPRRYGNTVLDSLETPSPMRTAIQDALARVATSEARAAAAREQVHALSFIPTPGAGKTPDRGAGAIISPNGEHISSPVIPLLAKQNGGGSDARERAIEMGKQRAKLAKRIRNRPMLTTPVKGPYTQLPAGHVSPVRTTP